MQPPPKVPKMTAVTRHPAVWLICFKDGFHLCHRNILKLYNCVFLGHVLGNNIRNCPITPSQTSLESCSLQSGQTWESYFSMSLPQPHLRQAWTDSCAFRESLKANLLGNCLESLVWKRNWTWSLAMTNHACTAPGRFPSCLSLLGSVKQHQRSVFFSLLNVCGLFVSLFAIFLNGAIISKSISLLSEKSHGLSGLITHVLFWIHHDIFFPSYIFPSVSVSLYSFS